MRLLTPDANVSSSVLLAYDHRGGCGSGSLGTDGRTDTQTDTHMDMKEERDRERESSTHKYMAGTFKR